ncbi:tRNA (mnm(5)s(2)U34)-methyltransferase [Garciella nitratireducens]|uniref:Putative rRNA methylase n=1 Tax=Garciella nitratireducens DSM 15102 TaxID=1121911 RepID=A0A1T4JUQ2_9FIRM|nr:class I SAM-dependent methyltransferase [Garciella nitratireducens]RBP45587.1 putative rRNA methylase [Garciella nitratireducens]SJZ33940.1 Putative rRNA methylase [Garciella nitratireducens DSM 15102]
MKSLFGSITDLSKFFINQVIEPGDYVIDATAGNGYDTLFLANLIVDKGKVFSFDIQKQAIENTKKLLSKKGIMHRVNLYHTNHIYIKKYVHNKIKAAMFNLGYLPGSDHSIMTRGESTIIALKQVLELLLPGGIVSICLYYGHPEGKEELKEVFSFIKTLDYKIYNVLKIDYYNKIHNPPILIIIEKR